MKEQLRLEKKTKKKKKKKKKKNYRFLKRQSNGVVLAKVAIMANTEIK